MCIRDSGWGVLKDWWILEWLRLSGRGGIWKKKRGRSRKRWLDDVTVDGYKMLDRMIEGSGGELLQKPKSTRCCELVKDKKEED